MKTATFYEVYAKRAIHDGIEGLVVMDRDTNLQKMRVSARKWGGCVARVNAEVLTKNPLTRRVISFKIVFIHKPRKKANPERDTLTHRALMGKLRQNSKSLYRGYRR